MVHSFTIRGMTENLRQRFGGRRVVVLDEMSMAKWGDLRVLDKFFRALTNRPNVPFGGIIVVLAGDFCQLPPVRGKYLYETPLKRP